MKARSFLVRPRPVRNAVQALLRKDTLIILIDLKGLEFPFYVNAPQLLMPVIMDIELVVDQLRRLKKLIKYRARIMGGKAKNLAEWNRQYPDKHMPRLFMLIDEFAELTTAADDQQMAANAINSTCDFCRQSHAASMNDC